MHSEFPLSLLIRSLNLFRLDRLLQQFADGHYEQHFTFTHRDESSCGDYAMICA
jgi:hypothetical protein